MPPSKRRKGKHANTSTARHTSTRQTTAAAVAAAQAAADAGRPFEAGSDVLAMAQVASSSSSSDTTKKNRASGGWITDENDLVLTSSKRRGVYECDYCHGDISQMPRIRCAVCEDFDLCLDCFAANLGGSTTAAAHNPCTHGYRVCDSTRYPIFPTSKQWSTKAFANAVAASTTTTRGGGGATTPPPPLSLASATDPSTVNNDAAVKEGGGATDTAGKTKTLSPTPMEIDNDAPAASKEGEMNVTTPALSKITVVAEAAATSAAAAASTTSSYTFRADDPKLYWTVEEDLRLLEGIENHGLGNWVEIAETVQGQGSVNKTAKRCMERYLDDYLGRYGQILPPYTLMPYEGDTVVGEEGGPEGAAAVGADSAMSSTDSLAGDSVAGGSVAAAPSRSSTPGPQSQGSTTDVATSVPEQAPAPAQDLPSRSSKRRAALFRSPTGISNTSSHHSSHYSNNSHAAQTLASRKKYKIVHTESVEGFKEQFWPHPYFPSNKPHILAGGEVGRDPMTKAEQAFVKAISSVQTDAEVQSLHQEWKETRLKQANGPTCLPPRPEDVMGMSGAELAGFMPRRGDFDIEWENDAEEAIGDMEFLPGDSQEDVQLKLQVLAIYNAKLDKREALKKFIISRKLWDYKTLHCDYERLPRDERDLAHRMRIFERFHTPEEHRVFLQDILKAKQLRKEVAKLQMYRRLGIRTMVEAEKFELDKVRRQFHKTAHATAQKKELDAQRKSGITISSGMGSTGSGGDDGNRNDDGYASTSSSLWKQYRTNDRRARKSTNREPSMSESSVGPTERNNDMSSSVMMDVEVPAAEATKHSEKPTPAQQGVVDGDRKPSAKSSDALPMESSTSVPFLSSQEVDLCHKVGLTHEQYREIKKVLVQESLMAGMLDKEGAGSSRRALIKMDVERRGQVLDFFLRAGWVSTRLSHIARSLPHSQQSQL